MTINDSELEFNANRTIITAIQDSECDTCECGSIFFKPVVIIKKISAFLSPNGKESIVPIDIFICDKCGKLSPSLEKEESLQKLITQNKIIKE